MEHFWKKNNDGSYSFSANGKIQGTFESTAREKNSGTNFTIENTKFKILRKGFWKSGIVILDTENYEVLAVKSLKWYGSSYAINYNDEQYILKIGNNPLAEWSIYKDSELQLAYALVQVNGKTGLKISGRNEAPTLFHFLLWYLIKPVIIENSGQDELLLLIITAT